MSMKKLIWPDRAQTVSVPDTNALMEGLIRRRIRGFYFEREIPKLGKLLGTLKRKADFSLGKTSLYKKFR